MHRTSLQETRKEQVFSLRGREGDATFSSIANSGRIANGLKGPVQIITEWPYALFRSLGITYVNSMMALTSLPIDRETIIPSAIL